MHYVVGADGLIGGALCGHFRRRHIPHIETSRRADASRVHLDLADTPDKWQLPDGPIDTAFLCAAQTSVAICENNPVETALINVDAAVELSRRLLSRGAFIVFLSTNLVFDGSKPYREITEAYSPVTEYGRQKTRAEQALLDLSGNVAVVRMTKVVHPGMELFRNWLDSLKNGDAIHPYNNLLVSPIAVEFALDVLDKIATHKPGGIIHLTGDRDITYEDCARIFAKGLGVSKELVQPVSSPEGGRGFSSLNMDCTVRELHVQVPSSVKCIETLFQSMI
jgi:dTDP-4-dehydrorhamnose reductase